MSVFELKSVVIFVKLVILVYLFNYFQQVIFTAACLENLQDGLIQ